MYDRGLIVVYVVADYDSSMKLNIQTSYNELIEIDPFGGGQGWMEGIWRILGRSTWTYQIHNPLQNQQIKAKKYISQFHTLQGIQINITH